MPKDSNYFEEASLLFRDSDPVVSRIAESLYQQMLAEHLHNGLFPRIDFNILYFYQAVIRLWLMQRPDETLRSTRFPYPCQPIHGKRWPDQLESASDNHNMVNRFVELVAADSTPSGEDFDVAYGARIIALSFDSKGELRNSPAAPEISEAEFDYWLSGFNKKL